MAFIHNNEVQYTELENAIRLATRIGLRQTNITLDLPEWDTIQKRDRLIGVSLSGVMDFQDALGWVQKPHGDTTYTTHSISTELAILLSRLKLIAESEALRYASEMRIPAPLLSLTIKPSGTISKLPTISAGIHRNRAPYYIRRVRITSSDPLAKVMLNAGFPVYPLVTSQGYTEAQYYEMKPYELAIELQKAHTWVIEFPVKTSATQRSMDESAVSQFGRYLDFQRYWTTHNTSVTIEFAPEEIPDLVEMLLQHWNEYVGVSFIMKNTTAYPQLPEQVITEEEYLRRYAQIQHITPSKILEDLQTIEFENAMTELLDADCIGGACPIR